jgi:hypothetical protein
VVLGEAVDDAGRAQLGVDRAGRSVRRTHLKDVAAREGAAGG